MPGGSGSRRSLASWGRWSRRSWGGCWDSTGPGRERGSSPRSSGPSSCWPSTGSSRSRPCDKRSPKEGAEMGIQDELRGGQRKQDFQDFVKRYDQGHPSEGYSDEEVIERYRDVAHAVPPDQYAQAAQEALARLSPEERAEFVRMLQER